MRLSHTEIAAIKDTVMRSDQQAKVYLYGSRVDDKKKGGDIDILVFSKKISFLDKLKIKTELYTQLGEQKIDLLIAENDSKPFVKIALTEAVQL